jgi:hypothetical protein
MIAAMWGGIHHGQWPHPAYDNSNGGIPRVAMAASRRRGLGEVVVSEVITTMCSARILPRIPMLDDCSDVCGIHDGQWPFATDESSDGSVIPIAGSGLKRPATRRKRWKRNPARGLWLQNILPRAAVEVNTPRWALASKHPVGAASAGEHPQGGSGLAPCP